MDIDISFESDTEEVTAAEVLQQLEEAWLNEKFAPEILPNKMEIVECMYLQIEEMEKNLNNLDRNDMRRCFHELELTRVRYLLSSYLRTRLLKIEHFFQTILEQDNAREVSGHERYLTESEKVFALSYKTVMEKYFSNMFEFITGYVPDESKDHPLKPNLHSFVFFQAKTSIDLVVDDAGSAQDEIVQIQEGSKMIMSYNNIVSMLKNNDVKLI